jgi:beta-galactosidase
MGVCEYLIWRAFFLYYNSTKYCFEPLGIYQGNVDEQWTDYSRPQESGAKSGTRWFTLSNSKGAGIKVVTSDNQALSFNVIHYSREDSA